MTLNAFEGNGRYGISAVSSESNRIYHNNLVDNTTNGNDNGSADVWDLFTDIVFELMTTPVFLDFYKTLDNSGNGTAQTNNFGPLNSGMAGLTM